VSRRPAEAVKSLARVLQGVSAREMKGMERAILSSRRVFVAGLGRTGLMARGFAMRLMHLGRRVYHVGDVITPAIRVGDLLVICSRTGRSPILSHYAEIARRARAKVAVVTGDRESPAARRADARLVLDDRVAVRPRTRRRGGGLPPLGSLFEQALLVVLDLVILDLMDTLGLSEADLARIHTTFE
jgi:6-phospho-3-hexuloisomerase